MYANMHVHKCICFFISEQAAIMYFKLIMCVHIYYTHMYICKYVGGNVKKLKVSRYLMATMSQRWVSKEKFKQKILHKKASKPVNFDCAPQIKKFWFWTISLYGSHLHTYIHIYIYTLVIGWEQFFWRS